jgi:hypothetical protein
VLSCLQEIEVTKDAKTYTTVARCPIHFVLTHENKGFEGLHLHEHDSHRILMGLCEGEVGHETGTPSNTPVGAKSPTFDARRHAMLAQVVPSCHMPPFRPASSISCCMS